MILLLRVFVRAFGWQCNGRGLTLGQRYKVLTPSEITEVITVASGLWYRSGHAARSDCCPVYCPLCGGAGLRRAKLVEPQPKAPVSMRTQSAAPTLSPTHIPRRN